MSEGGHDEAGTPQSEELQAELEHWKAKAQELAANQAPAASADLQNEVKRWKRKAQEAEALLADAASLGSSPAEAKVKELARKNRDLHVQLNKAREEVVQERAKAAAATGEETPTYSQQKAQAKLDAEAQLEIAKYKRLYTGGAERLGRLQQEKDKFSKEVITLQAANKELHGKLALLQDQLRSYHKSESPERDQKTIRSVEDRGGLVWKNRHREQSEQLARATADLEKTRLAAEAALGRREALERDIKTLRLRIKEMLDKSATDDELIAALTAERERYRAGAAPQAGGMEAGQLKQLVKQQSAQLDRQEKIINALQSQLESGVAERAPSEAALAHPVDGTGDTAEVEWEAQNGGLDLGGSADGEAPDLNAVGSAAASADGGAHATVGA